jgi:hypothetical protein
MPPAVTTGHERARALVGDDVAVNDPSVEQQHVLYAAATHSTLTELLMKWQPWTPGLESRDMAIHIPRLAQAIIELVDGGLVEVFLGTPDGESGLVSGQDVPAVVRDPDSWYGGRRGPLVELILTAAAGLVSLPPRPPGTSSETGR